MSEVSKPKLVMAMSPGRATRNVFYISALAKMKKTVTRTNFAIKYLVESTDVFYQSERGILYFQ